MSCRRNKLWHYWTWRWPRSPISMLEVLKFYSCISFKLLYFSTDHISWDLSTLAKLTRCAWWRLCVSRNRVKCGSGTVRSRYIAVIFLRIFHERLPIARPWGRVMGCRSWVQGLIEVVRLQLLRCANYLVIDDRHVSRVSSNVFVPSTLGPNWCNDG